MTCRGYRRLFSAYLEGELDVSERYRFERHMKECKRCSAEFSQFRKVVILAKHLPLIESSPDFDRNLRAKLTEIERASEFKSPFGRRFVVLAGVFTLLMVLTLGIYLYKVDRSANQNADKPVQTLIGTESIPLVQSRVYETVSTRFIMPSVSAIRVSGSEFGDNMQTAAKDWQKESRTFVMPFVTDKHATQYKSDRNYVIKKINVVQDSDEIGL